MRRARILPVLLSAIAAGVARADDSPAEPSLTEWPLSDPPSQAAAEQPTWDQPKGVAAERPLSSPPSQAATEQPTSDPLNHAATGPFAEANAAVTARGPLIYPEGPGPYRFRLGVGLSMDVLPLRVVQSETRQLPQLLAQLRFGLPWGFSADARLAAIVIKNQLELGLSWSARVGKIWLSAFDHHGFAYGTVGVQGFNSRSWGWLNKPGLAAGFALDYLRFTLSYELIYTLTQHARLGDLTTLRKLDIGFAGDSLTVTVETMLRGGGIVFFGVGLARTAPNYELWLAFSDQRARLPHPRFFAGYAF